MPSAILRYFEYAHLPEHLQAVSRPIGDLARQMEDRVPDGPEKSAGLRKLLEAKDCLVRAMLPALMLACFLAAAAAAQCPDGRCPTQSTPVVRYASPRVAYYPPAVATAAPTPTARVGPASVDPYNFGAWLNAVRAQYYRRPLAYDPGLSAEAAANSERGFGHFGMGSARRQNVGMGAAAACWGLWNNPRDPAHQSALLDPSLTAYGIACVNGVWTYSAR